MGKIKDIEKDLLLIEFMNHACYGILETGGNPLKAKFESVKEMRAGLKRGYTLNISYSSNWDYLMPVYIKISNIIQSYIDFPGDLDIDPMLTQALLDKPVLERAVLSGDIDWAFKSVYKMVKKYWKK